MIKILHVTFDMGIGGTEQVIRQLLLGMDPSHFQQQICCIEAKVGAMGQQLQQGGVKVHCLARQPGLDFALIRKLKKIINAQNIDIVHCHQYTPWFYGWIAALGLKAKVIFTEHGRFFPDNFRWKAWFVNKVMASTSYAITAISAATKDALVKYEFINAKKIRVIYNGIEALSYSENTLQQLRTQFKLALTDKVIGTVARLDSIKNQAMILTAFSQICAEDDHVKLLIVGDGPEKQSLENLANNLQISSRVIFAGFQSPANNHMALLDIFLLPSFSEGTSMTLLEAMSLGIPCIVSNVGGNPEVIADKQNGLVLKQNNTEHLSKAMQFYLNNPSAVQQAAEQAKLRFAKQFSAKPMLENFALLYSQILPERK